MPDVPIMSFLPIIPFLEASPVSPTTLYLKQGSPIGTLQTCQTGPLIVPEHIVPLHRGTSAWNVPLPLLLHAYLSLTHAPAPSPISQLFKGLPELTETSPSLNCRISVPLIWYLLYTTVWGSDSFLCQCPFYPMTSLTFPVGSHTQSLAYKVSS